jgi:hypothetical protein
VISIVLIGFIHGRSRPGWRDVVGLDWSSLGDCSSLAGLWGFDDGDFFGHEIVQLVDEGVYLPVGGDDMALQDR